MRSAPPARGDSPRVRGRAEHPPEGSAGSQGYTGRQQTLPPTVTRTDTCRHLNTYTPTHLHTLTHLHAHICLIIRSARLPSAFLASLSPHFELPSPPLIDTLAQTHVDTRTRHLYTHTYTPTRTHTYTHTLTHTHLHTHGGICLAPPGRGASRSLPGPLADRRPHRIAQPAPSLPAVYSLPCPQSSMLALSLTPKGIGAGRGRHRGPPLLGGGRGHRAGGTGVGSVRARALPTVVCRSRSPHARARARAHTHTHTRKGGGGDLADEVGDLVDGVALVLDHGRHVNEELVQLHQALPPRTRARAQTHTSTHKRSSARLCPRRPRRTRTRHHPGARGHHPVRVSAQ